MSGDLLFFSWVQHQLSPNILGSFCSILAQEFIYGLQDNELWLTLSGTVELWQIYTILWLLCLQNVTVECDHRLNYEFCLVCCGILVPKWVISGLNQLFIFLLHRKLSQVPYKLFHYEGLQLCPTNLATYLFKSLYYSINKLLLKPMKVVPSYQVQRPLSLNSELDWQSAASRYTSEPTVMTTSSYLMFLQLFRCISELNTS